MPELSRGKYLHDFKVNVKSVLSFIPLLNIIYINRKQWRKY